MNNSSQVKSSSPQPRMWAGRPCFPKPRPSLPMWHAAIVARELGIPAVVGCGNATTRLKTGDRVIVDGGQGVVQILT